ncbi:hypothetical protein PLICRDRAFT_108412 [Plicaturopsis crispa FD-325 SS-3]|nr:hypothetical protein PLICRDRAFT_108412 [Plicaturopsis crispa FD-325 SS-3]
MSSCGNPTAETDALMPRRLKFDKSRSCVRCKASVGNIVIRHAVYCKDCFFPLVTSKFRRCLDPSVRMDLKPDGPRRMKLKASGNLLIGYSGGLGSTVLSDLVSRCYFSPEVAAPDDAKGGKDHPRNVRVWKKATVCYVEICNAFPGMRDKTEEIRRAVQQYPEFDFIPLRIEDAFDSRWWAKVGGSESLHLGLDLSNEDLPVSPVPDSNQHSTPVESLQLYLSSLPTQTAIPTSIHTLIRLLLLHTANTTESSHLVLGTSLTSLSIALISSISQGGGYVVREEAQEEWTPPILQRSETARTKKRSIKVIRPLRDVGMKECAAWAFWNESTVVGKDKLPGSKHGIGGLTKDFIVGLEKDYPSTVSAIARTCGKLAPKDASSRTCALCARPAQMDVQGWKSRTAIRSYEPPDPKSDDPTTSNGNIHAETETTDHLPPSLTPYLCYACHTTLTSRSSRGAVQKHGEPSVQCKIVLPVWVYSRLFDGPPSGSVPVEETSMHGDRSREEVWKGRRLGGAEMKHLVADFLLDE